MNRRKKKKNKIQKIAPPIKPLKGIEVRYRKELNKLGLMLIRSINKEILPVIKAGQSQYMVDSVSSNLEVIFERLNKQFTGTLIAAFAQNLSTTVVEETSKTNEEKFNKSIRKATGVDLGSVIQTEGLNEFLQSSVNKNVSLIKSIPEEYFKQIETIVNNGIASGAKYQTIAKEIQAIPNIKLKKPGGANYKLVNRIKTIARNEVSTINAQLTKRRSESLGITEGIWRSSEDESVRKCHRIRNGKKFNLKKGLYSSCDGKNLYPGEEINCRCTYSPIIDIEREAA